MYQLQPRRVRYLLMVILTQYKLEKLNYLVFKICTHLHQFHHRCLKEKSYSFSGCLWHYLRSSVQILLQPILHHSWSFAWSRLEDDSWQPREFPSQGKSSLQGGLWGCRLSLFSGSKMANVPCHVQTPAKPVQEMCFVLGREDKFWCFLLPVEAQSWLFSCSIFVRQEL